MKLIFTPKLRPIELYLPAEFQLDPITFTPLKIQNSCFLCMFDSFFGFKTHHMWSTPKAIRLVFSVLVLLLEFYLSVKFHPYSTPSSLSKIPKIGQNCIHFLFGADSRLPLLKKISWGLKIRLMHFFTLLLVLLLGPLGRCQGLRV